MKLSHLVFTSLFILADVAAAVKNGTAVPNILYGGIGINGDKSRVFIKFVPGGKAAALSALGHVGGEVIHSFSELNTFSVSLPTASIEALRRDPKIAFIEQDPIRSVGPIVRSTAKASPFDRRRATDGQTVPYGVDMVQARDVWDANRDGFVDEGSPNGSNRMICIIDTGFLVSHEDLQGINVNGYDGNLPWNEDGGGSNIPPNFRRHKQGRRSVPWPIRQTLRGPRRLIVVWLIFSAGIDGPNRSAHRNSARVSNPPLTPLLPQLCCGGIDAAPHPHVLPEKWSSQRSAR